jgi:isoquinoline 1-oxidoreductase
MRHQPLVPGPDEPERYELREDLGGVFAVTRREFLGAAGAGLLFSVAPPPPAHAQRADGERLEARLFLGEDGLVTVFTGKIEEGQGARTELAMAAAEELGLPLERVRVVTADTSRTPNDGTTAGSRTTPGTVPLVRKAAAAARELLRTAAARQWNVDRAELEVRDGGVAQGGLIFRYRDLAAAPELAAAYKDAPPADTPLRAPAEWRVLGAPHHRVDAREIVTGRHRYPSDIVRPGLLYGRVLRPPSYGASLESVDLAPARKIQGCVVVRDGDFVGCVAPTGFDARKALEAVAATARWKTAAHPSDDVLFEHLRRHAVDDARARRQLRGSIEQGLAESALRRTAAYRVAYVQHAPMEPRAAVAEWDSDGRLTVWAGTSNPFRVAQQLAEAFRVAPDRVRVIVPDMGGGFGGKHTGEAALEAARLAREAGRPVKVQWTRAEEFTWAYFRPAALIEVEAGLAAGAIVAWDFTNYNSGASALDTPYRIPHTRVRFLESESPLRQGSYRCLAATANNFAREAFTDELAEAAGRDPLEFRLAHLENERLKNVLLAAAGRFRWEERRKNRRPGRGVGLACGTEKNSVVATCVEMEVDRDTGTVKPVEIVEAFECGAILNPANLQAQVEGCILMGLGPALREEVRFGDGRLLNARFSAYRVPRFADAPRTEVILLDRRDLEPAGGGETPIIAVAPAIANAVYDAAGERVRSMPVRLSHG